MQRVKYIIKANWIENLSEKKRYCAGRAPNSLWKIMTSARAGEGTVHHHAVLLRPPIVRSWKRKRCRPTPPTRWSLLVPPLFQPFSSLTIIALILLAPTSPIGSSDRCFPLFAEDSLSFSPQQAPRVFSKATGGLMRSFVAVDGIKISVALL